MAATKVVKWFAEHDEELRTRHATGDSLHVIAAAMGFSKATISRKAKELGLDWDRAQTAAATATRQTIIAERLSQLTMDYLDDAQRFRRLNLNPYRYDWREGAVEMHHPLPGDQLKLQQASIASKNAALRIIAHQSNDNVEQAKSLLSDLAGALNIDTAPPVDDEPAK